MSLEIAKTILEQLGGRRFSIMTGAKNFVSMKPDENSLGGLKFSIGRNATACNTVMIKLMLDDTYTVQFMKFSPKNLTLTVLEESSDVYCDMLREVFTSYTGLYTHL